MNKIDDVLLDPAVLSKQVEFCVELECGEKLREKYRMADLQAAVLRIFKQLNGKFHDVQFLRADPNVERSLRKILKPSDWFLVVQRKDVVLCIFPNAAQDLYLCRWDAWYPNHDTRQSGEFRPGEDGSGFPTTAKNLIELVPALVQVYSNLSGFGTKQAAQESSENKAS